MVGSGGGFDRLEGRRSGVHLHREWKYEYGLCAGSRGGDAPGRRLAQVLPLSARFDAYADGVCRRPSGRPVHGAERAGRAARPRQHHGLRPGRADRADRRSFRSRLCHRLPGLRRLGHPAGQRDGTGPEYDVYTPLREAGLPVLGSVHDHVLSGEASEGTGRGRRFEAARPVGRHPRGREDRVSGRGGRGGPGRFPVL